MIRGRGYSLGDSGPLMRSIGAVALAGRHWLVGTGWSALAGPREEVGDRLPELAGDGLATKMKMT